MKLMMTLQIASKNGCWRTITDRFAPAASEPTKEQKAQHGLPNHQSCGTKSRA
jgi:hypothetical protein